MIALIPRPIIVNVQAQALAGQLKQQKAKKRLAKTMSAKAKPAEK